MPPRTPVAEAVSNALDGALPVPPKEHPGYLRPLLPRPLERFLGGLTLVLALPFVTVQVGLSTLLDALDRRLTHVQSLVAMGNGSELAAGLFGRLVANPRDAFLVPTTLWLGLALPCYLGFEFHACCVREGGSFDWRRAALFNLVRIGPMYCNFMYVYVLCHREAHMNGRMFTPRLRPLLGWIYNYFIGPMHGVVPGVFTLSHLHNHHRYHNGREDVYSTASEPRDSLLSFARYVYVWFAYALNVSSYRQFVHEGRHGMARRTAICTLVYISTLSALFALCPLFTFWYLFYPLVEGNVLLALVNYVWHSHVEGPGAAGSPYVNSTTILDGLNFTLNEELHVVHHQYAGVHWSRNPELFRRHAAGYARDIGTVYRSANIFEVGVLIIMGRYGDLADRFVQVDAKGDVVPREKGLPRDKIAEIIKKRVQYVAWTDDDDDDDDPQEVKGKKKGE